MSFDKDTMWTFRGTDVFTEETIIPHRKNTHHLEMSKGDIIHIRDPEKEKSYLWKGYKWGFNINTTKTGYFPTYKTKKRHKVVHFPV